MSERPRGWCSTFAAISRLAVASGALVGAGAVSCSAWGQFFERPLIRGIGSGEKPPGEERAIWAELDLLVNPFDPAQGEVGVVPENILREFVNEWSRGRYERAERLARDLIALTPKRPYGYYNLACALARLNRIDEAVVALDQAIERGWRNRVQLEADLDLDAMRGHRRYLAALTKLEQLHEAERIHPSPPRDSDWEMIARELEQAAPGILAAHHVPGASIVLVQDGRIVWSAGFGVGDPRTNEPVRAKTRFKLEAPSNLLTAIAALQLEEQGVWRLDDPLARWLPLMEEIAPDAAARLTVRAALTHTGGLRGRFAALSLEDGVDEELRKRLRFDATIPSDRPFFCNEAFLAVGRAIELALGNGFELEEAGDPDEFEAPTLNEFIRARVLRPLMLTETTFNRPRRPFGGHAVGHTWLGTPYRDVVTPISPGGPVYTTAEDLGRVLEFLLGGMDEAERAPLDRDARERLHDDPRGLGFGLGFAVRSTEHGRVAQLADRNGGIGLLMRWHPDAKIGVAILYNSDTGAPAAKRLARMALGGE